ncbi:MAG TPA: hypothetical protein VFD75_11740 [Pyrinomonadaceae bacterium]|nr:hypothetical protein [Pyrinomonadaceae bacterium]
MQKKFSRLLFLFAALVVSAIVVVALLKISEGSSASAESTPTLPTRGPVQVVRFALYDLGIYPQEARAKPGLVTIAIEDLSGDSSGLSIERIEAASRVPSGVVSKTTNRLRSRTELFLPEGRYEVSDVTRPDNRALLIVEP